MVRELVGMDRFGLWAKVRWWAGCRMFGRGEEWPSWQRWPACFLGRGWLGSLGLAASLLHGEEPWRRHTIDASLRGADGVRLGDVNRDGRMDIATGWEEGRTVRIYRQPAQAGEPWPWETVGQVCAAEDAVFADVDDDGALDVISSCEEGQPTGVFVHWGPGWKTDAIPAASPRQRWIYALPVRLPGDRRQHLVAGGKSTAEPPEAELLLLSPPRRGSARALGQWTAKRLARVGWTMTLASLDMDGDGLEDLLVSDRRGATSGVFWLRYPGWERHEIGARGREVMFAAWGDINGDGRTDVAAAVREDAVVWWERLDATGDRWREHALRYPEGAGTAKAVAIGDMNGDGRNDLVLTCERSAGKEGVWWLEQRTDGTWRPHRVSGPEGIKFDRIELLDLDGDGDLDVVTTEEQSPLGVIWYENPGR
jgi:hypothetical protein